MLVLPPLRVDARACQTFAICCSIVLVVVAGTPAGLQAQADPQPRLVLNTFGPAAQTRSLAFSRDSSRLYSAGLDKVVHVWEAGWDQVEEGKPDKLTYARPIRWEIGRGLRGQIYGIASCPTRHELAIAGLCLRGQSGDVCLADLGANDITASLPTPPERDANSAASGHQHNVVSVDYSPTGKYLLSSDANERIFLWQRNAIAQWSGRELRPDLGPTPFPAPAICTAEDQFVLGIRLQDGTYKLQQQNFQGQTTVRFPEIYPLRIAALARSRADFWAAADGAGKVYLTRLDDSKIRFAIRAKLPHITALAFGPDHQLAIASNETLDDAPGQGCVELWNLKTRQRSDFAIVSRQEKVLDVVISPDGHFLATSDEDRNDILLFRLRDDNNAALPRPLSTRQPGRGSGTSRAVRSVAISADGGRIGFGQTAGKIEQQIVVDTAEIAPVADWNEPLDDPVLANWNARYQPSEPHRIEVFRGNQQITAITLDPIYQGPFAASCFVPGLTGGPDPGAVAIATEVSNGIFLYSLPNNGEAPRLLRWFYDHGDKPMDLTVSRDGRMLVSGAMDGTVKVWNLRGIYGSDREFANASQWGASFGIRQGRVVATSVDEAGIAYAKGLRNGDQILTARGYLADGNVVGATVPESSAAQIFQVLENVSAFRQVLLAAQEGAKRKDFIIRPGWEPLLTAHFNRLGEWAIWHPRGYFNASPAEGGEVFGWQFNQGQDQPTRVLSGDQLQKEFERPAVIRGLLNGLPLEPALAAIGGNQPSLAGVSRTVPEVKIIAPTAFADTPSEDPQSIVARIRFNAGNPQQFQVSCSVDGRRLGTPMRRQQPNGDWYYSWDTELLSRMNQIEVLATERGGAMSTLYASDVVYLRGSGSEDRPYRLHILSVASEKYPGTLVSGRGGFGPLEFPIDDVSAVTDSLLTKHQAGLAKFNKGEVFSLTDEQVSRDNVGRTINRLNQVIANQYAADRNVLIVYLAGHGKTVDGQYFYITPDVTSADDDEVRTKGIAWSLFEQAGRADCQVLYMIDTCHSGTAVDLKSSIRDPKRSQGIVFAAASGTSAALERRDLKHGVFSFSVLLALTGRADREGGDQNGQIDLMELVAFVTEKTVSFSSNQQRPAIAPQRLSSTLNLPLVRTEENQ